MYKHMLLLLLHAYNNKSNYEDKKAVNVKTCSLVLGCQTKRVNFKVHIFFYSLE